MHLPPSHCLLICLQSELAVCISGKNYHPTFNHGQEAAGDIIKLQHGAAKKTDILISALGSPGLQDWYIVI